MESNLIKENNLHPLVRSSIVMNKLKFLKTLESNGFKLNALDREGYSSLMIAVKYDSLEVIQYLIEIGADVDYKAPDGKMARDLTTKQEILDLLIPKPVESAFPLDQFELIEWEPEPAIKILEQNPEEIEKSQVFFDYITTTNLLDDREDWDSEGFELPDSLEIPKKILLPLDCAKRLANILHLHQIYPHDYEALELLGKPKGDWVGRDPRSIKTPSIEYNEFNIALSCAGVLIESENFDCQDYVDNRLLSSYENEITDFLDVIIEERGNLNPLYDIYRLQHELKQRDYLSTEDLFEEIKKREHALVETVISSRNALILLLSQYTNIEIILENEGSSSLEENEGDETREELDETSEVETDDVGLNNQLKYSVSKTLFRSSSCSEEVVNSLIRDLVSYDTYSNQLTEQCLKVIRKILPTTAAYEIVLNNLAGSENQELVIDRIDNLLAEIQSLRYEIALQNYGLVPYVFNLLLFRDVEAVDLCQEGFLGLMQAIEKYDNSYGAALSTYAIFWIRQRMTRYRDDTFSTIRFPVHFLTECHKYKALLEEYEETDLTTSADGEFARQWNISKENMKNYCSRYKEIVSLDELIENSPIFGLLDYENYDDVEPFLGPNEYEYSEAFSDYHDYGDSVDSAILLNIFDQYLQEFSDRNRDIIVKRYGLDGGRPMTLERLGKRYDITRERVRQIEVKTLKKLRGIARFKDVLKQFM